jgi:hypothetical protein
MNGSTLTATFAMMHDWSDCDDSCPTVARRLRADLRLTLVAILILVVRCTLVCAQPDDYSHLVNLYAAGDIQGAVSQLARWPRERDASAVDTIARTAERRPVWSNIQRAAPQLRAASMLETDLAAARLEDEEAVDFHLSLARRLIGLIGLSKDQDNSAREFVGHWYEVAGSIYLSLGSLDKASWYVRAGGGVSPDNPMFYVYRGAITELRAAVSATDARGGAAQVALGPTPRQHGTA